MTEAQRMTVDRLLAELLPSLVLHGDCVGADAQFHNLAKTHRIGVSIYPGVPLGDSRRAGCQGYVSLWPVKSFIARNHDIVDSSDSLIAVVSGYAELLRSGTWATVRYARKLGKPIRIVWPDGSVKEE
jgi:hypothetical protein